MQSVFANALSEALEHVPRNPSRGTCSRFLSCRAFYPKTGSHFSECALTKHAPLSRTRHETLGWLVLLIVRFGAVSLWRLAAHVKTGAKIDSVRRRFYRFFQHVRLDAALGARMTVRMLGLAGKSFVLAIDRTNWRLGKTEINILMISVDWRGPFETPPCGGSSG